MKKFLATILSVILLLTIIPMAYAEEGNTYKVGDIIEFGSYPQSEVKDETLIAELNALAPEWDEWTSYGYYSGDENYGSMVQGDWMRYIDIKHDGERYRGVKFTQYRPYSTLYNSSSSYTYQADNGYNTNTVYWFKFESIDWRVLDPSTGLVMCETIIDSQPYSNTIYSNGGGAYGYFNDASYKNYASDYETSSIRKWLNEDFYNTAFTDSEKKEISTTTLNNDGYYTSVGTTGYEKLDSNETKDKIFLLSYNEVRNSNFGFNSSSSAYDTARFGKGSDYAQSQGLYVYRSFGSTYNGNSNWLLRSPGISSSHCCYVFSYGNSGSGCPVRNTSNGVRPALRFNRISDIGQSVHQHSYSSVVTNPTCTEQGYTTYMCECGGSYIDDYTEPSHTWSEWSTNVYTQKTRYCLLCEEKEVVGDVYVGTVTNLTASSDCESITLDWDEVAGATHYRVYRYSTVTGKYTRLCQTTDSKYVYKGLRKGSYTIAIKAFAKIGDSEYSGEHKDFDFYFNGHSYEEFITPPTCTSMGYITYICHCGESYVSEDYIEKLEHKCVLETVKEPTCSEEGYTTYACACGYSYRDDYTPTIAHSFTNYISDGKATCSTNGLKIAKCDNCDATDSIVISGDHSFSDEWTIDEEPTCKEEGMKSHHCKYCSARKDFTPIGKLAHDFVTVRVEPTCLDEGYTITACRCGEEIIEPIAPTGHVFDGSKCKVCYFDKADDCSCNCHKGGIMGFFWKIINFFNKLFKNNQQCKCGIAHY